MGGSISKLTSNEQRGGTTKYTSDESSLDFVVAYYILSMNIQSIKDMQDNDKCLELLNVISDVIGKEITKEDIISKYNSIQNRNAIKYIPDMCRTIADHYVKIAKIYSSIVTAINPEYEYIDDEGNIIKKNIQTKHDIPFDKEFSLSKLSFCGSRINSLTERNGEERICIANANTLEEQLGIPELYDLYCDADYDETTGQFLGMTQQTKDEFNTTLKSFYSIFTGQKNVPNNIKRFGDIPLNHYDKTAVCGQVGGADANENDDLLTMYAKNLRNMIVKVNDRQIKLMDILNTLFTYDKLNNSTNNRMVRVRNKLTNKMLYELSIETRKLLSDLYLSCEIDYLKGIQLYEAIMEMQILNTSKKQLDYMNKLHELLKYPDPINRT